jgi:hypothetical protein
MEVERPRWKCGPRGWRWLGFVCPGKLSTLQGNKRISAPRGQIGVHRTNGMAKPRINFALSSE